MMVWSVVGLALCVAFLFSGMEAGLLSLNRVRLRHRIKQGDRTALLLEAMLRDVERVFITVLVVTNLATLVAVVLSTRELVRLTGGWGYAVVLVAGIFLRLLLVEVFPKALFRGMGYRSVSAFLVPLVFADRLLGPMHRFGKWLSRSVFRKRLPTGHRMFVGREDFKYLTLSSARGGEISPAVSALIRRVIDFRPIPVGQFSREVSGSVVADSQTDVGGFTVVGTRGHRNRVLIRDGVEGVSGWVDVAELVRHGVDRGAAGAYRRRVLRVPETEPAVLVLRRLRSSGTPVAVVVGESGGDVGYVFREDLERSLLIA
jgi:CBS domain containing-hemolysin-like protein